MTAYRTRWTIASLLHAAFVALGFSLATLPAAAQVTEPNGLMVPQPVQQRELDVALSRGYPEEALTLPGLFACFNDPVDWQTNAGTGPSVFSPLCGFTGTLVMRGGGCRLDFGWYNASASGTAPTDAEIYTLVPADPPERSDFCPLAGSSTQVQLGNTCNSCVDDRGSAVQTFNANSIRTDDRYAGGLIGFALRGLTGSQCTQTHFSQNELNPRCVPDGTITCTQPNEPWIMALIYQSVAVPDAFYIAFEDLPATNFGPNMGQNDGDFNDFVYFITGLTCDGAGQPCATDMLGACANGLTSCGADGAITCNQVVTGGAELCDNIDNDCNGVVDDGEGLCPGDQFCYRGACVPPCGTGEFQCGADEICQDSACVDPLCAGITCPVDQVCRGGTCVGACEGVVCPHGHECQLGRCVDLCAAAACPAEEVCEQGVCVRNCSCRTCPADTECALDGHCKPSACKDVTCPAGQYCEGGTCLDSCTGAVCPGGANCVNGACEPPMPGTGGSAGSTGTGGSAGTIIVVGGTSGSGPGTGGSGPGTGGSGASSGSGGSAPIPSTDPGCACSTPRAPSTPFGLLSIAGLGLLLGLRRRRQAA
jgi:MYXO-CTERM domain-containing protein